MCGTTAPNWAHTDADGWKCYACPAGSAYDAAKR